MDKIICLGKNYREHAAEMGEKLPSRPVIFLKPFSVLHICSPLSSRPIPFPSLYHGPIHHELEIVLRIKEDFFAESFSEASSLQNQSLTLADLIDGVTIGLDLTKRLLQSQLKKEGHPWCISKVFPGAAIIGPWKTDLPYDDKGLNLSFQLQQLPFSLSLNGTIKQQGRISEMLYSPLQCLFHVAHYFPLKKGDLLFTGTPAGVGEISRGDAAHLEWGEIAYSLQWV